MSRNDTLNKKLHDICFAVFRVASLIRHNELRREIEFSAIRLISKPSKSNIDSLLRLINLSVSVKEVAEINRDVLEGELLTLRKSISSFAELPDEAIEVDLGDIFQNPEIKKEIYNKKPNNTLKKQSSSYPQKRRNELKEFIRQLPEGCRMRDLLIQFPDVSERTLRSDIQKLIDSGDIERMGSKSGPFSYLRAVDNNPYDRENTSSSLYSGIENSSDMKNINEDYALLSEGNPIY